MNWIKVKNLIKNNFITKNIYKNIRNQILTEQSAINIQIPEIQSLEARKYALPDDRVRINILIPSLDVQHVFGGIATALTVFEKICSYCKVMQRIIVTDGAVDKNNLVVLPHNYDIVSSSCDANTNYQIVPFSDRYGKTLPVTRNDLFFATAWWTAFTAENLIRWQSMEYDCELRPLLYLIQDYEPGFYPWSSRYLMADSTYHLEIPVVAIFNSKQLLDYFNDKNYFFYNTFYFEPELNVELKQYLEDHHADCAVRKKQILVYARPSVDRNAFSLIVGVLRQWVQQQEDINEWTIIGAGEMFPTVDLGNGKVLTSIGKVSLKEYARLMLETKVGISLMVSPHPSYPPLEMAAFGIRVLTNTYANKNLKSFSPNIISLSNCSIRNMANTLLQACNQPDGIIDMEIEYIQQIKDDRWKEIMRSINYEIKKIKDF